MVYVPPVSISYAIARADRYYQYAGMIYITDAHIAGSTHTFPTETGTVQMTTDLPCEEQHYESGVSDPNGTRSDHQLIRFRTYLSLPR